MNKKRLTYCWGGSSNSNKPNRWKPNGSDIAPFKNPHEPILKTASSRNRSKVFGHHLRLLRSDIEQFISLPFTIDLEDYKLDCPKEMKFEAAIRAASVPFFYTYISPYHDWEHMVHERCYSIWSFKDEHGLEIANELLNSPAALELLA